MGGKCVCVCVCVYIDRHVKGKMKNVCSETSDKGHSLLRTQYKKNLY